MHTINCSNSILLISRHNVNCLILESSDMKASELEEDIDDSLVDEIQDLLQSSDSELEWSDEEIPRPKV